MTSSVTFLWRVLHDLFRVFVSVPPATLSPSVYALGDFAARLRRGVSLKARVSLLLLLLRFVVRISRATQCSTNCYGSC